MALKCDGCGNDKAYALKYYSSEMAWRCLCDRCGSVSISINNADVYWEGRGFNRGICDDNGKPIFLESKEHKVRLMKEKGLREAGDMHHGARGTEFEKVNGLKATRQREHKEQVKQAGQIFREGLKRLKK